MSRLLTRSILLLALTLGLAALPTLAAAGEASGQSTVKSVDPVNGTLELHGGTVLLVLPTTRVVTPEGLALTLADVKAEDEEPVYYEGTERAGSVNATLVMVGGLPD